MLKIFFRDSASPPFQNQVFFLIFEKVGNIEVTYFIGNIVGREIKIDPSKIDAIMKWPVPTNVSKVESFIGAVQYP